MDCSQIPQQIALDQQEIQQRQDPSYCDGADDVLQCRKENAQAIARLRREIALLQTDSLWCGEIIGTWALSADAPYSGTLTIMAWDTNGPFSATFVFADGSQGIPQVCNFSPYAWEQLELQVRTSFSIPGNPQGVLTYFGSLANLAPNGVLGMIGVLNGTPDQTAQ